MMSILNPTPQSKLVDDLNRPYFLWDCDLTLDEFETQLHGPDIEASAYLAAKLMRQAKPDDVFQFLSPQELADLWPKTKGYLGKESQFWDWLLQVLEKIGRVRR